MSEYPDARDGDTSGAAKHFQLPGKDEYVRYVRKAIEAGLKDAEEGRTISVDEVRRQLGLEVSDAPA